MNNPETQGPNLDTISLERVLNHVFNRNNGLSSTEKRTTPVCIWGSHGIGKTEIVKDFAISRGWHFAYCAPAQFEEMGDLHGIPLVHDSNEEEKNSEKVTVFAPPDWVPTAKGPGILLLDDINRADERILRGIMQLLQNFEMFSWQLPEHWHIVATANPEGAEYSITPMDDAMLTRMIHFTLIFDARAWARWAAARGVDPRGISFVLTYPEAVTGLRTTPRTLVHFFEQIEGIKDLNAETELVATLAAACLDETSVAAFISFVKDDLSTLLDPDQILDAENPQEWKTRFNELATGKSGEKRVDRISAICTRLLLHVTSERYIEKSSHSDNFAEFLSLEMIPNDLRVSLLMDLNRRASKHASNLLKNKKLARLLLEKL
jgi:hypothetical protein